MGVDPCLAYDISKNGCYVLRGHVENVQKRRDLLDKMPKLEKKINNNIFCLDPIANCSPNSNTRDGMSY